MIFIQHAFADTAAQVNPSTNHLLHGIANAGIVVQLLLLSMVALSVWNWLIIFKKKNQFTQIAEQNEAFLEVFWKATNLQQISTQLEPHSASPLAKVFGAGYQEIERVVSSQQTGGAMMTGMENLERTLRKAHDEEVAQMENQLSVLATTGSTAPFIGLLGTVIGIMNSFQDIAQSGSASLAVVAPGISEALFATAIGLFAAIPAVIFYNYLINKIKKLENQLNGFSSDFLNIARRNFFKTN
jgi:biopolymer transport protein TolQ